jgi:hypothetical protein
MKTERFSLLLVIHRAIGSAYDKTELWICAKGFALMLAIFLCLPKRQRMSHNNGIAATGTLRIVDNPRFPRHAFFAPGKVYPCRIRHASVSLLDDAINDVRAIAIKFSDQRMQSPFDIEMNTGAVSPFWSALSFLKFGWLRQEKWAIAYQNYNRLYPDGLKGNIAGGRRHVSSFHNLRYSCMTPFLYVGDDGIKRYAKYRVLPLEDEPESGIDPNPSEWDWCNQRVLPHETRGRNYLKYEYQDRVAREGAKYRMQIQTRQAQDDDDPEVFNNTVIWDESVYPWQELAVIAIEKTLDWEESLLTTFSVKNMPKTLGILPANSIYDYNSLNYMRAHSELARKARLLSYKLFGLPPPIPDNDNRNVSGWGE